MARSARVFLDDLKTLAPSLEQLEIRFWGWQHFWEGLQQDERTQALDEMKRLQSRCTRLGNPLQYLL
jgi:hypothetical protein